MLLPDGLPPVPPQEPAADPLPTDGCGNDDDEANVAAAAIEDMVLDNVPEEDEDDEDGDMCLGFAVEPPEEPAALLRNHTPSKLGGRPAWLDPVRLPLDSELQCGASGEPLNFLLQVYAPLEAAGPAAFHRAIYVFISPKGSRIGERGTVRAFRCQLPRANAYLPYEAPEPSELPAPLPTAAAAVARRRCARLAESSAGAGRVAPSYTYREHELVVEPEPTAAEASDAVRDPQVSYIPASYPYL